MIATLLTLHILVTISLIGIILIQKSEGGALGIGSSHTGMFSARQSANMLTRATAILAVLFFSLAISIAFISTGGNSEKQAPGIFEEGKPIIPGLNIPIPNSSTDKTKPPVTGEKQLQPTNNAPPLPKNK